MIKTLTLDGLTSVTIKQSAYDMARFCWVNNRSDSDIFMSCTDPHCTENADGVKHIPAGEHGMLDTESYETLYIKGSGMVNIETSPFAVCPFGEGKKGGGTSLSGSASYTISNAVDYPLLGLNLYGKSTQDGTPTPDTPVDIVSVGDSGSVTITVDNGDSISTAAAITSALPLCGIPVDSGGNYTDSNGQQWVCDYVDFERGVKVQRVEAVKLTADNFLQFDVNKKRVSHSINQHIAEGNSVNYTMCNCLFPSFASWTYESGAKYFIFNTMIYMWTQNFGVETEKDWKTFIANNDIIVYHALATPIETPLSETELQAYRKLQTYNGMTNISNSAGAEMSVKYCTNKMLSEYVLPITMGLQKQIDELRAAVLSMGGNV